MREVGENAGGCLSTTILLGVSSPCLTSGCEGGTSSSTCSAGSLTSPFYRLVNRLLVPSLAMRPLKSLPGGLGGGIVFAPCRVMPRLTKDIFSCHGSVRGPWMTTNAEYGTWIAHRIGSMLGRIGPDHLD